MNTADDFDDDGATGETTIQMESRPESLTTAVYDSIRTAILKRQIKPGERVTEASLAESLRVSKTPVREALLELRRVGLIVDWGRRGGMVIEPSREAFLQVSEIREAIEVFVSAKAAASASGKERKLISDLAQLSYNEAAAWDRDRFHRANVRFHSALADAAANPRLRAMLVDAFDLSSLLRVRDLPPLDNLKQLAEDHLELAHQIEAGDVPAATETARRHVIWTRREILEAFDQTPAKVTRLARKA